ncbi:ribonuclease P protein component [bacterium]|nr:ribonuclease P protein component [bacterium]
MNPPTKKRFGKHQRIRYSAEFRRVREKGQRWVQGCLIANWLEVTDRPHSRLGVITSRKIGKAHVRNRARRLMRESYRNIQHQCVHPMDLILVARKSIANKSQQEVEADLCAIMKRRGLLESCEG